MDVWEHTTLGDGDAAHELVELFVVSDGELQVSWRDSRLLVVSCGVAGQLEDLGGEVPGGVRWEGSGVGTPIIVSSPAQQHCKQQFFEKKNPLKKRKEKNKKEVAYSRTAARYTGAPAPTRAPTLPFLR